MVAGNYIAARSHKSEFPFLSESCSPQRGLLGFSVTIRPWACMARSTVHDGRQRVLKHTQTQEIAISSNWSAERPTGTTAPISIQIADKASQWSLHGITTYLYVNGPLRSPGRSSIADRESPKKIEILGEISVALKKSHRNEALYAAAKGSPSNFTSIRSLAPPNSGLDAESSRPFSSIRTFTALFRESANWTVCSIASSNGCRSTVISLPCPAGRTGS